jgi:sortase (surface protein transpeptidase)
MPGRVTLDDVDMRARLRPLSRGASQATYISRPAPEPSHKLFQDVTVVNDFQFPTAFVQPPRPSADPVQQISPSPEPTLQSVAERVSPNRQQVPVAPHQPEPSRVLMRQAFVTPAAPRQPEVPEVIETFTPIFEATVAPPHMTFTPPPKPRQVMLLRLRKKPGIIVLRLGRTLKAMPLQQRVLVGMAGFVLIAGSVISLSGLQANKLAGTQAAKATIASATSATTTNSTSTAPSTAIVTADTLRSYQVAPDLARYIAIPKLGVLARVLQVGETKDGALATPSNVFDAAWYKGSAKPGAPGATLIDGHVSSWTTNGVFYGIKNLVAGDSIEITKGDNTKLEYTVVKTVAYPVDNVDMNSLMQPITAGKSGLNLITCGGKYDSKSGEFTQRIGVYATLND